MTIEEYLEILKNLEKEELEELADYIDERKFKIYNSLKKGHVSFATNGYIVTALNRSTLHMIQESIDILLGRVN